MDVPAFRTYPGRRSTDPPAGSDQFKLQFLMFVPTADLFAQMRIAAAAQQFQKDFMDGETDDNGLERHITATRRQNFLVPPRRHRAFPLLELADKSGQAKKSRQQSSQAQNAGSSGGSGSGGSNGSSGSGASNGSGSGGSGSSANGGHGGSGGGHGGSGGGHHHGG